MNKQLILILLSVLLALPVLGTSPAYGDTLPAAESEHHNTNSGSLVIVGGALGSSNSQIYQRFLDLAGGSQAKIGIIPAASGSLSSARAFQSDLCERYGLAADAVEILPLSCHDFKGTDENEAELWQDNENDPLLAEKICSLTGIWMVGGDQTLITETLLNPDGSHSLALEAIWSMHENGGVLGGTSAGAAVMSETMLAGGDSLGALLYGFTDQYDDMSQQEYGPVYLEKGLGFFDYGIIDQHFDEKARLGRLIVTAYEKGSSSQLAYGIDEDTALVVDQKNKTAEVVGRGGVTVIDLSKTSGTLAGEATVLNNIVLSYLRAGDTIQLDTKTISIEEGRSGADTKGYEYMSYHAVPQTGALTPYGRLKDYLAYALMDNDQQDQVTSYIYDERGRGFQLTFRSGKDSNGWFGTQGEKELYSITNVEMSIQPMTITFTATDHSSYKAPEIQPVPAHSHSSGISGSLVIVGGATTPDGDYYKEFLDLAGGRDAKIGIIPAASGKLTSSRNFRNIMISLGVPENQIEILPIATKDYDDAEILIEEGKHWSEDEELAARIEAMTGIWMVGGDQTLITEALLREDGSFSKALDAIWRMYENGGVLGGTSAGAAVMSDVMLAGGDSLGTLRDGFISEAEYEDMSQQEYGPAILAPGLGFFPYGIIDQHFDQKARLGRLIATHYEVGNHSQLSFGIDENTALIVDNANGTATISGAGGITVIDLQETERTGSHTYKNVLISHLKPGDTVNLKTNELSFSDHKEGTRGYEYNDYIALPNTGLMSNHGLLKNFLPHALTDNAANDAVMTYSFDEQGRGFALTFRKTDQTNGYWGYADGQKDDYSTYRVALDISPVQATVTTSLPDPASDFIDMPGDWMAGPLKQAIHRGLFSGYTTKSGVRYIRPDNVLTRAELAAIAVRISLPAEIADLSAVSDVPADAWYADAMARAVAAGWIAGESELRPLAPATRQETCRVLTQALALSPEDAAHLQRLMSDGSSSKTDDTITRAELAVLLSQIM